MYERLTETLRTRSVGRVIHEFDFVNSTNTAARLLLEEDASVPDGTVIVAREQSAGRGRLGRAWHSPRDAGLYLSVILRPDGRNGFESGGNAVGARRDCALPSGSPGFVSIAAGAAVMLMLRHYYGLDALIKWPNDVLIDGRKVCGVLVERIKPGTYILGIGLNTNWTPQTLHDMESAAEQADAAQVPGILRIPPGALSIAPGENVESFDHAVLLGRLLESVDVLYTAVLRKLHRSVIRRVQRRLFGVGEAVIFGQGQSSRGIFDGINHEGHALVRCEDGTVLAVQSGEVHFADRN